MDRTMHRLLAIVVVHVVILVVQRVVRRRLPRLDKDGHFGIYLIMMPLGFGMAGLDLSYLVVGPMAFAGLAVLLRAVGKMGG